MKSEAEAGDGCCILVLGRSRTRRKEINDRHERGECHPCPHSHRDRGTVPTEDAHAHLPKIPRDTSESPGVIPSECGDCGALSWTNLTLAVCTSFYHSRTCAQEVPSHPVPRAKGQGTQGTEGRGKGRVPAADRFPDSPWILASLGRARALGGASEAPRREPAKAVFTFGRMGA